MGMFIIYCPLCQASHYWFSGNLDQRCPRCIRFDALKYAYRNLPGPQLSET